MLGAAGGDRGTRDFIVALDAATGKLVWRKYVIPAPGEPGSETWKDKNNAWQTGGGAMWVTGSYDPSSNQVFWGTGNAVPPYDPYYRPGDNLYTDSLISWDAELRQDELVLPSTRRATTGITTRPAPISWSTVRSRASRARSSPIRRATAFSIRWSATTERRC